MFIIIIVVCYYFYDYPSKPISQAFPIGMVLNYNMGLCCSRTLKLWPNLTLMLNRFVTHHHPDFKHTTQRGPRNGKHNC